LRGYGKEGVLDAIRAAGGEIYAITSEPQSLARNAQEDWKTGIEHVGDPHQEILGSCRDRGWLSLFTTHWSADLVGGVSWVSHPRGYFQPGVLAIRGSGRVLYRWRSRPTRQNIGGAVARPTPGHVWKRVQAALAEPADAPDVPHDDAPELDSPPVPWPVFLALLLSNGWFLKPAVFDQRANGPSVRSRLRNAALRIPFFLAAWVAAFAWLPVWIPSVALVAWIAKVTPGIRSVNAQFQNLRPNEEPA
jgi:hypothetical protein